MFKFPDFSLTGKCSPIFPGFQVEVGTMVKMHEIRNIMSNPYDLNVMHLNMHSLMNKQANLKEVLNNL